jgi:hypothetical protein
MKLHSSHFLSDLSRQMSYVPAEIWQAAAAAGT